MAGRAGKLAACLLMGVATLSQTARAVPSYATAVMADSPVAFWQLAETTNPNPGPVTALDSSGNGFSGTYGVNAQNAADGIFAPQSTGYPAYAGFAANQGALGCSTVAGGDLTSVVTLPPLSGLPATGATLTNGETIAMWIQPEAAVPASVGLLFMRGSDTAGFGFSGTLANGTASLGYTWNNNSATTYNYNSGLYPPTYYWSFVALVVQSNKATIYLDYLDPNNSAAPVLSSVVQTTPETTEAFSGGTILLGADSSAANRSFPGNISDAAIFSKALTSDQVLQLFASGVGVAGFAPTITGQPQSQYVLAGGSAQFRATGINGTSPIGYQWTLNGTAVNLLSDAANFSGANSNILTVLNVAAGDVGSYRLVITNAIGTAFSSNATLTIQTGALVGEWFDGSVAASNLLDVSGYTLAANHGAYAIGGGNYVLTNDVPPGKTGQSVLFWDGASGLAISNSSTLDANYDNTFDNVINHAVTISFWARGWPTTWSPWVSKFGDFVTYPDFSTTAGWQIRSYGSGPYACFSYRDLNVGVSSMAGGINGDDMGATIDPSQDANWHFYTGTFDGGTGVRDLYVDGQLSAQNTNDVPYVLAAAEHLCIGARDQPAGNNFTGYANTNLEIFDVRIYNYAIASTNVAQLYGVVPAAVNGQPVSVAAFTNTAAKFSATVGGTQPLTLQWQLNGTNVNLLADAANFSGANSNVLTVLAVTPADVGSYHLIVTNAYGSAVSSNALLTIVPRTIVGEWFTNGTLNDLSGFTPAGTHDGYAVGAGSYYFTNDVPLGESGQSIEFPTSDSAIAIANSSTADSAYTNTFDQNEFSVAFWAKDRGPGGAPWIAWVSKDGYNNDGEYNGLGWSVGIEAWSQDLYFDLDGIDNGATVYTLGDGLWGNTVMESSPQALPGNNTTWHHYAATYNPVTRVRNLYFDGGLVGQQTNLVSSYALAANKHLMIGGQEQTTAGFTGFARASIFDARIYNYALTASQVAAILPHPLITVQPPASFSAYNGVTFKINSTVTTFNKAVTYQWQLNGTNLVDGAYGGGYIVGSATNVLTVEDTTTNFQGLYNLVITYSGGSQTSSGANVTVSQTVAAPAGNLVGEWLMGGTNLADVSGYSPAGTHDGYGVAGAGVASSSYRFTNDVPPGVTGSNSLWLYAGSTAIAISNSSTLDANYTNTFDDNLTNAFSVAFWAKGYPGNWNAFVSKYGEGPGWQMRDEGDNADSGFSLRGNHGTITLGSTPYGDSEDLRGTIPSNDNSWHHYAGTYDSVTGIRNWYVDGALSGQVTGDGPYNMDTEEHLAIGGKDQPAGNNFTGYFTGEIYGLHIYNTALSAAQVNSLIPPVPLTTASPTWTGRPVINGSQLVLTYSSGTLLGATNILGPWTPVAGATSPYTNNVTAAPQMFFKLQ